MFSLDDVSLCAVIIGLVEVVKAFAVPKRWCLVASIVIGVLLLEGIEATFQFPFIKPWVLAGVKGVVLGLTATGLYMVSKKFRPAGPETPEVFAPPRRR